MKLAFLYAGQGSQHTGMGKDLYDSNEIFKNVIDRSAEALMKDDDWVRNHPEETDLRKIMFENPNDCLLQTENTQPAMVAFACAMSAVLNDAGIRPDTALGLSLGEYSALEEAGVWSDTDTVKLTAFRGQAMADAAKNIECGMSAVLKLDEAPLKKCCEDASDDNGQVYICNYNCPGQLVIGGEKNAVDKASEAAKTAGAKRVIPLKVSGPFHTPYMRPAGDALHFKFKSLPFNDPTTRVLFNFTGDDHGIKPCNKNATTAGDGKYADELRKLLQLQVQNPVHMEDSLRLLLSEGYDTFLEIGPGKALTGFVKKTMKDMDIDPESITLLPVETKEEAEEAIRRLK